MTESALPDEDPSLIEPFTPTTVIEQEGRRRAATDPGATPGSLRRGSSMSAGSGHGIADRIQSTEGEHVIWAEEIPYGSSAGEALIDAVSGIVDREAVLSMQERQRAVWTSLAATGEALTAHNNWSSTTRDALKHEWAQRVGLVRGLKDDMDEVFARIGALERRIAALYPDDWGAAIAAHPDIEIEDD